MALVIGADVVLLLPVLVQWNSGIVKSVRSPARSSQILHYQCSGGGLYREKLPVGKLTFLY